MNYAFKMMEIDFGIFKEFFQNTASTLK